jgi:hypothetical protein
MYTDQMGQFPGQFSIRSSCGNQYLMVAVEMDGNYIHGKLMKMWEPGLLVKVYCAMMEHW